MTLRIELPSGPPDLPTTATMCANCGQILDPREIIGRAPQQDFVPEYTTRDGLRIIEGIREVYYLCPKCHLDLSDPPPHEIVIIRADAYPKIANLTNEKYNLQTLIHQHRKNLHYREMQIAKHGEANAPLHLLNSRDDEQEQIHSLEQELRKVEQKIQTKLSNLLRL